MNDDAHARPSEPVRKSRIAVLAEEVASLSTGDRALLRRIFLTRSYEADGVVLGLVRRVGLLRHLGAREFERWRLLSHVAALLAGAGGRDCFSLHRPFGLALFDAGYSENRLIRLLNARGSMLDDQIVRAARMLAQGGEPAVNLAQVHGLTDDRADQAEVARLRVAQDYYDAEFKAGKAQGERA